MNSKRSWRESSAAVVTSATSRLERDLLFTMFTMTALSLIIATRIYTGITYLSRSETRRDSFIFYASPIITLLTGILSAWATTNSGGSLSYGGSHGGIRNEM